VRLRRGNHHENAHDGDAGNNDADAPAPPLAVVALERIDQQLVASLHRRFETGLFVEVCHG
jgi:hypothetical protein